MSDTTRRNTDWLIFNVGKMLMDGKSPGMVDHDTDRLVHGLLEAHRSLLRANGVPLTPPDDWASPNVVNGLDVAKDSS